MIDPSVRCALETQARQLRRDVVEMVYRTGDGHPGPSLSVADIVTALYFHILTIDPNRPDWDDRDRFVLSKGHSCPVLYAALARKGYFPVEELMTLRYFGSHLQGHPYAPKTKGLDATTGSLGNGVSIGLGMALAARIRHKSHRVYVVIGDGELGEGLIWEAAMAASHQKAANLTVFIDNNNYQSGGTVGEISGPYPIQEKWESFGWHCRTIDGHDVSQIIDAVDEAKSVSDRPSAIVCKTVKGKGVSFMIGDNTWHKRVYTETEYRQAIAELGGCDMSVVYDSTRIGFRDALIELAAKRDDIVFVSTDSLKVVKGEPFLERWPERVIELGIAEQNGVAVCSGLASSGLLPYICTYAGFLTMRACEQMRTFVAYPKLKVRFIGANGGMHGGNREGVSHQFIEDVGILRTIPGFTVLCPADGGQVRQAMLASVDIDGPVYIRIGSGKEEKVFPDGTAFPLGRARTLASYGTDVALFCNGFIVNRVLEAAKRLGSLGIQATVVEVATVKPLDVPSIVQTLRSCRCAVTVEDHTIIGGLGSAIAETIAEHVPATLVRLGLRDCYGESGFPDELLDAYGMAVADIVSAAQRVVAAKPVV